MKKIYFYFTFLVVVLNQDAFAQSIPVVGTISGPAGVCSSPVATTYTATASNSPTSFIWSASPSGVVFSNPTGSITSVSFPYPYANPSFIISCTASNSFGTSAPKSKTVLVSETPIVTFSGLQNFCQGSSTHLTGVPNIISASSTLSYQWSPSIGLSSTNSFSVNANPLTTTTYNVLLTLGSCTNTTQVTLTVYPCTVGINSFSGSEANKIKVYPNPNNGTFIITSGTSETARILNELGQIVRILNLSSESDTEIKGLPVGIYFLTTERKRIKIVVADAN